MLSDVISSVLLLLGSFLLLTSALGLLRFPDVYNRIHATGMCETMGAGLILAALMMQAGSATVFFKLMFILLLLWLTSPTASHTLVKAARHGDLRPVAGRVDNDERVGKGGST